MCYYLVHLGVVLWSKHLLVHTADHQILRIYKEVRVFDEVSMHLLIINSPFLEYLAVLFFQILLIVAIQVIRDIFLGLLFLIEVVGLRDDHSAENHVDDERLIQLLLLFPLLKFVVDLLVVRLWVGMKR